MLSSRAGLRWQSRQWLLWVTTAFHGYLLAQGPPPSSGWSWTHLQELLARQQPRRTWRNGASVTFCKRWCLVMIGVSYVFLAGTLLFTMRPPWVLVAPGAL